VPRAADHRSRGVLAGREGVAGGAARPAGADRHAVAEGLGEGDDVGLHAGGVLVPEPASGAAQAGLDLVEDEEGLALVAELADRCEVSGRGGLHSPFALDRFEEHGADPLVEAAGEGVDVAEGDVAEPGGERLERLVLLGLAGGGEGGEVRPWNEPYAASTWWRSGPPWRWPWRRASLMAHSLASAPELEKKTRPPPPSSWSRRAARRGWSHSGNRFETWRRVRAWSASASATAGWACPSDVTAIPPRKSR